MLFNVIKSRDWSNVVKRCKSHNKNEAATWIVEKNSDGSLRWKLLPLHHACENKAPSEVVKALIEAFPSGVGMKDSGGDLPLHLACRERASKSVISYLLHADPEAAKVEDDEGRLPLHLACRQGAGVEIIDNLIISYHRAARTADSYSLLPLHWACAQNATPEVIESLLRANPDAVDNKDKWGRTPMSLTLASTNSQKEAIVEKLKKDPSYWTTQIKREINSLKYKLEETSTTEKISSNRAKTLESKLADVTEASNSAAVSFRELKNELEDENAELKERVRTLTVQNNNSEHLLDKLNEENTRMSRELKSLTTRLTAITSIFRSMENQRKQILQVTGDMEESLHKAADIAAEKY